MTNIRTRNHGSANGPTPAPAGSVHEPSALARAIGEVAFYREHNADFGPYLRKLREERGLSLGDAADQLGMTFAKLQKMETGGCFRIDSLDVFARLADLYVRPRNEVLEESVFARLMLHPALRPLRMDEHWLESFSPLQKEQMVEFAKRLEKFVLHDFGSLESVLEPEA